MRDPLDEKLDEFLRADDIQVKGSLSASVINEASKQSKVNGRSKYYFWPTTLAAAACLLFLLFNEQPSQQPSPPKSVVLSSTLNLDHEEQVLLEDIMFFSHDFGEPIFLLDDQTLDLFAMLQSTPE
jgi:hypothetical protein